MTQGSMTGVNNAKPENLHFRIICNKVNMVAVSLQSIFKLSKKHCKRPSSDKRSKPPTENNDNTLLDQYAIVKLVDHPSDITSRNEFDSVNSEEDHADSERLMLGEVEQIGQSTRMNQRERITITSAGARPRFDGNITEETPSVRPRRNNAVRRCSITRYSPGF